MFNKNKECFSFDIDGVLNNYPDCWVEYINHQLGSSFNSKGEALNVLGDVEYDEIKDKYRSSGYKYTLEVNEEAKLLIDELSKKYCICIMTTRPFHKYLDMYDKTYEWLKCNNIEFDVLASKTDFNIKNNPNIKFHIDDELEHCKIYLQYGVKCFVKGRKDSRDNEEVNVIYVEDLLEVLLYL